jgi:hypothetical protein
MISILLKHVANTVASYELIVHVFRYCGLYVCKSQRTLISVGGCIRFDTKDVGVNMECAVFTESFRHINLESVTQQK